MRELQAPPEAPGLRPQPGPAHLAQLSPFTRVQALAAGVTIRQLRTLLHQGFVRPILHGVYSWADAPALELDDVHGRARAVALVLPPGGVVARRTAAWIFGIDTRSPLERDAPIPLECIVPTGTTPVRRAGLHCFAADLTDDDITDFEGLLCTTPLRTTADLLRWLSVPMGLTVADRFAAAGLIAPIAVLDVLDRWPGHRFVAQARQHAAWIEPRTESAGETWLRLRILEAGFPRPQAQIPILDVAGREVYRLDMGWLDRRIGLEYDGLDFHSSAEDQARDAHRRERLEREFRWSVTGVGMGEVLGRSLTLERGIGELLGLEPQILRRRW